MATVEVRGAAAETGRKAKNAISSINRMQSDFRMGAPPFFIILLITTSTLRCEFLDKGAME